MQDVHALDRRRTDHFDRKIHRHPAGSDDVAHQRLSDRQFLLPSPTCGSSENAVTSSANVPTHFEEQPCAGRAVMPSFAQRLEQSVARQLRHEITGQSADRAECRCARRSRTWTPFVVVAVAHDADPIALVECIMEKPFEGAPGRVHLHAALDAPVVSFFDVGVAPADMGDDTAVLAVERFETVRPRCRRRRWRLLPRPGCATSGGSAGPRGGRNMFRSPPMPVLPDHS